MLSNHIIIRIQTYPIFLVNKINEAYCKHHRNRNSFDELSTIYIHIRLDNNMIPFNIHTNKVIICTSDFITT